MSGCRMDADKLIFLKTRARNVRRQILEMFHAAGGGHFGGCLSLVDVLTALYFDILRIDPGRPTWEKRDRFVLSKGHAAAAFAAVLAEAGYIHPQDLMTFNQFDSSFSTHTDRFKVPGCEVSCGSLGHGLSIAGGMALAAKLERKNHRVFCVIGDGENMEGMVWEAAMVAAHYELDNLICIVDRNYMMLDGHTEEIMRLEPLLEKWRAFGWSCKRCSGHDFSEIIEALWSVPWESGKPSLLIANTTKGKGIPFIENETVWHFRDLSEDEYQSAMQALAEDGTLGGN